MDNQMEDGKWQMEYMLTIIHGADIALSRKYFLEEKQKYPEAVLLDAEKVNLTDLAQIFQGGGLFGETKQVFIEQLLTKKKKSSDYKEIISYLETHADEHAIFLWENKELERSSLNVVKKAMVKVFQLPQSLFLFLDTIKPRSGKSLPPLFHQTLKSSETEMIFFMLVRQVRLLLALNAAKLKDENPIDELKRMSPWQKSKLQKQASLFTQDQLLTIYQKLFEIEKAQKTGTLAAPMISTIDFLLLEV